MVKAIVITAPGGPEVLQLQDIPLTALGPKEITIRHTAIEVNFVDIYQRKGVYDLKREPKVPGASAVGVVEQVGNEIDYLKAGDKVAYATAMGGAYSERRNINAELVFSVEKGIDEKLLAASLVKGMTAHYLCKRVFQAREGFGVLIHAAAGGVGQALAQMCNEAGAYVIGAVGSDDKKQIALDAGCHVVVNYNNPDWPKKINEITKGLGLNAVYDSVGKAVFDGSLEVLSDFGIYVLYGSSSGDIETIETKRLAAKSLFFTRPSLFHYKKNRKELVLTGQDIMYRLKEGTLKTNVFAEIPLTEAHEAHKLLESRKATGSIILIP